jgi:ABC-type uncharacterized transport system substrate-binding protein
VLLKTGIESAMRKVIYAILCLLLFLPTTVVAHPHVFIDNYPQLEFDDSGFAGIRVAWVFDEMFSASMLLDYDDGDGRFSSQETAAIKAEAFDNLKEYGYFFHIEIAGKPFPVKFVRDFSAALKGGHLIYRFLVPCHVPATANAKKISVSITDDSNFVAIMTKKSDVSLQPETPGYRLQLSYDPAPPTLLLMSPGAISTLNLQFQLP